MGLSAWLGVTWLSRGHPGLHTLLCHEHPRLRYTEQLMGNHADIYAGMPENEDT